MNTVAENIESPSRSLHFSLNPTAQNIFRARVFENPLMPIGEPLPTENTALADALIKYSKRASQDDFSSLTDFLNNHPKSTWNISLLANLGLEYFHTGHYSKTLAVWELAWELGRTVADFRSKAVVDLAVSELAYMYARLGLMVELDTLLKSVQDRVFSGSATEKITGACEGLWNMRNRPEISFRCGPFALYQIKLALDSFNSGAELIHACASTVKGFSLLQLKELSQKLNLDFQMSFRQENAAFIVPCVIHLKVNHFAAIIQQEDDCYLLQDSTFGHDLWITRNTLEAEASGYFLISPGELTHGWRTVEAQEGETVWGKGQTGGNDPDPLAPCDLASPGAGSCPGDGGDCKGMAVPRVHLMLVSLNINDEPVGYLPHVGPAVHFTVRYNQREANQPQTGFTYSNLGQKWTFDWLSYISESSTSADVKYYIMGGGQRTFTGFDRESNTFAFQQLDQTQLKRIARIPNDNYYEMISRDGSRKIFERSDGSVGISRKIFLTQLIDAHGQKVELTYDNNLRIVKITDAIGQVTTISYDLPADIFKITRVTDPFGRFATFDYDDQGRLIKITDVIGITSQFTYDGGDFITTLTTPYGVTAFDKDTMSHNSAPLGSVATPGNTRALEITYPNGDKERVEYNQVAFAGASVEWHNLPEGMLAEKDFYDFRNTFYWGKKAYAAGYPDYRMATIYHWLHGLAHVKDLNTTAGILESIKEPLENRVWFDYAGQGQNPISVGNTNKPTHVGRLLDDGSTQLYTYEYNDFGNITKQVDPVGRTFSYRYADNGIDLLETRQTRTSQSELLSDMTYNDKHLLLTSTDAAGQTTIYTYNDRGQVLTKTNAKNETTTYRYDIDGRLTSIDGPLPGASIVFTYDSMSRVRTKTDESGYTLTFEYDAMDRLTKITCPDGTFDQYTYTLLDHSLIQDRAGRQSSFEYNNIRQMTRRTDPLNRSTLFQWCKCGALRSLTDPMGRTTDWKHDIQGRVISKKYVDESKIIYRYEDTTSRLRQRIDEKLQVTQYNYNRDDTLACITYNNATVATPPVAFTYDASYLRLSSMTDGTGTTQYDYIPITPLPTLGAGQLASVDGTLPDDTIMFGYDEVGRRVSTAINGVAVNDTYDAAGRIVSTTNALGVFTTTYDGNSFRKSSQSYSNGQTTEFSYAGNLQDQHLRTITNKLGATLISEFIYGHNIPTGQITSWSQQAGIQIPSIYGFSYDPVDQLIAASVSEGGNVVKTIGYSYDPAGNRLTEKVDATTRQFSYNALNELTSIEGDSSPDVNYQWDAEHRLISVTSGNENTEFTYDGLGRRVGIRSLVNDAEVSERRFLWCDNEICEERTSAGTVTKRFFAQGVNLETGGATGNLFYTRDHLGSVREIADSSGNVEARYSYELFGKSTRLMGVVVTNFGFANMFWAPEASLNLTKFRAYDPSIGRWLSRDLLANAEFDEGPNLFGYVHNDPLNAVDPLGLMYEVCCPSGSIPKPIPTCEQNAGAALILCIRHAVEIEPGDYRSYRAQKCYRDYYIAVNACPKFCFRGIS